MSALIALSTFATCLLGMEKDAETPAPIKYLVMKADKPAQCAGIKDSTLFVYFGLHNLPIDSVCKKDVAHLIETPQLNIESLRMIPTWLFGHEQHCNAIYHQEWRESPYTQELDYAGVEFQKIYEAHAAYSGDTPIPKKLGIEDIKEYNPKVIMGFVIYYKVVQVVEQIQQNYYTLIESLIKQQRQIAGRETDNLDNFYMLMDYLYTLPVEKIAQGIRAVQYTEQCIQNHCLTLQENLGYSQTLTQNIAKQYPKTILEARNFAKGIKQESFYPFLNLVGPQCVAVLMPFICEHRTKVWVKNMMWVDDSFFQGAETIMGMGHIFGEEGFYKLLKDKGYTFLLRDNSNGDFRPLTDEEDHALTAPFKFS